MSAALWFLAIFGAGVLLNICMFLWVARKESNGPATIIIGLALCAVPYVPTVFILLGWVSNVGKRAWQRITKRRGALE